MVASLADSYKLELASDVPSTVLVSETLNMCASTLPYSSLG